MAFKSATASVESAIDLTASASRGDGLFMRFIRVVEEKETQDGQNPLEVDAWLLDGPDAGTFQEKMWIFPSGMRNKIDTTVGANSAGRLEIYKARGRDCLGLTSLTPEQVKAAEAKDEELSGSSAAPAGSAKGTGADEEAPF
jgi:hypothetical protein